MKLTKIYLFIPILLILLSCTSPSADKKIAALTDSIPEGAVPFEYDPNRIRAILIPGTLNDSIHVRYLLETGSVEMLFSDSLASDLEIKEDNEQFHKVQKTMKVRIGDWERTSGDSFEACYLDKKNPIFSFLGKDMSILTWKFFDKKILEISFSKQYIRELLGTPDLAGYDSLKMEVHNGFLGIPAVASIQGKKIREFVTIDTGCNGDIKYSNSVVSKYGIKSDSAFFGQAQFLNGNLKEFFIKCDSIQIGNYFFTQRSHVAFSLDQQRPYPFLGLLGNRLLQNFDIVMDLRNYYLYLKPVEKYKHNAKVLAETVH